MDEICKEDNLEEIKEIHDHPMRKKVVVKLADLYGLASVHHYWELPMIVKDFYSFFSYTELIRPLVYKDRKKGLSFSIIARKHGLTIRQIQHMCNTKF